MAAIEPGWLRRLIARRRRDRRERAWAADDAETVTWMLAWVRLAPVAFPRP